MQFYERLLRKEDPLTTRGNVQQLQEILNYQIPQEQKEILISPISEEEIKHVLWGTEDNKESRLDGCHSHFFTTSWHIMGKSFTKALLKIFYSAKLLKGVNSTRTTLVPKIPNPTKMTDFSILLHYVYKCVTKVLADRLKQILPNFISKNNVLL